MLKDARVTGRRRLRIALSMAALLEDIPSWAQQPGKVSRLAILDLHSPSISLVPAFLKELQGLGYVEGKNLTVDWRFAEGHYERVPDLAATLIGLKPDVIVTYSTPSVRAFKKATSTIPIVAIKVGDPVGNRLAVSLARPGGNVTGLANPGEDISPKYLELLIALYPKLSCVAVLLNPGNNVFSTVGMPGIQAVARRTKVKVMTIEARSPGEIESAFAVMTREGVEAVIVGVDALFALQQTQIAELALKHRLLSMFAFRQVSELAGLMSYGQDAHYYFRRAALYVDKILKGAQPGELPFEQPTRFQLVINRRTAKALGVPLPQELLLRADEVID
jgi:putative ABC transport system substrate-binding protein